MIAGFSASLSGLLAQTRRLAVSADNIANMQSRGFRQNGPAVQPGAYIPKRVQDVTTAGGGVRAEVRPVAPPSVAVYAPAAPNAEADSVASLLNVSLAGAPVIQNQAHRASQTKADAPTTHD